MLELRRKCSVDLTNAKNDVLLERHQIDNDPWTDMTQELCCSRQDCILCSLLSPDLRCLLQTAGQAVISDYTNTESLPVQWHKTACCSYVTRNKSSQTISRPLQRMEQIPLHPPGWECSPGLYNIQILASVHIRMVGRHELRFAPHPWLNYFPRFKHFIVRHIWRDVLHFAVWDPWSSWMLHPAPALPWQREW